MANLVSNSFLSITDNGGRIGRIQWINSLPRDDFPHDRWGLIWWDPWWPNRPPSLSRLQRLAAEIRQNTFLAFQALQPSLEQATRAIEQFRKALGELQ